METPKAQGPVECLGLEFPDDHARREHFLGLLRAGLQELREKLSVPFTSVDDTYERLKSLQYWPLGTDEQIRDLARRIAHAASSTRDPRLGARDILGLYKDEVGFPIGADEDILALSDPPYYTACPNPFVRDFIAHWSNEKRGLRTEENTDSLSPQSSLLSPQSSSLSPDATQSSSLSPQSSLLSPQSSLLITQSSVLSPQSSPLSPQSSSLSPHSYHREPFAADVSEGKNDPIYNAHSYHTKVPHKAIMRYILHYTEPGDIVFDGFCGTGMTGVAAQMCGDRAAVESLGYRVDKDGSIYQQEAGEDGKAVWKPFSKLGARRAVLNDLSPAATFIAYNYNTPVDVDAFEREAKRILKEVEDECGWMYRTLRTEVKGLRTESPEMWAEKIRACKTADEIRSLLSPQSSVLGTINYTVWSDVFICPDCTREVVFWEAAVDKAAGKVRDEFPCPHCNALLTKRHMERAWVTKNDPYITQSSSLSPDATQSSSLSPQSSSLSPDATQSSSLSPQSSSLSPDATQSSSLSPQSSIIRQAKQVPVLINYSVGNKRFEKTPDAFDLALLEKIEQLEIPYWFPTDAIPRGDKTGEPLRIGLTHVHHFYTKRNLWVLGAATGRISLSNMVTSTIRLLISSYNLTHSSIMSRIIFKSEGNKPILTGYQSGTLYASSMPVEKNIVESIRKMKIDLFIEALRGIISSNLVETSSSSIIALMENSVDYVFTDPPFGGNLMYSELNFLWEAWLKVFTNNKPEAITNEAQGKGLPEYQKLMTDCFKEYYRVLKPGRWMTVEFHNSKNAVWNAIQEALQAAGFVVADVRTLDKKQGSFNQVTQAGAVKQDLIISCYKPNGGLEERFKLEGGTEQGVWDFVRTHLAQLPVAVVRTEGRGLRTESDNSALSTQSSSLEIVAERQKYLLYDRMVAFHVQRGVMVPLSSTEFYAGLAQRFPERDGMYFLPEQVAEYDKKRMKAKEVLQLTLFVTDEASAIRWLNEQLRKKPQTFQELHPQFMREIAGWEKYEKPLELMELLEENFLCYDGKGPIPKQIVSWLKQSEEMRKIIQEELASGRATEENGQLITQSSSLITRSKDRWYVPDPNKASDLEKLRDRALLREFEEYQTSNQRRLKVFRLEAVRAGFKRAWQERDYATIIAVARKIPENVLQEDQKLLMWYDQAITRSGDTENR
jgi:DNA modification methylase